MTRSSRPLVLALLVLLAGLVPVAAASPASAYYECTPNVTVVLDYDQDVTGDQVQIKARTSGWCKGRIAWDLELYRIPQGVGCDHTCAQGELVNRWKSSGDGVTRMTITKRQGGQPAYYKAVFGAKGRISSEGEQSRKQTSSGYLFCNRYSCRK